MATLQSAWPFGIGELVGWPEGFGARSNLVCDRARRVRGDPDVRQWQLELHDDASGLEAEVELRLVCGRAVNVIEYRGALTNRSHRPIEAVRAVASLDWPLRDPELGEPWCRTLAGGPFIDVGFPPHGFSVHDLQLLRHEQYGHSRPYNVLFAAAEDGRCSAHRMPMMVVTDGRGRRGMFVMQDWFGLWRMGVRPGTAALADQLTVWIGFGGLDLSLQPGESLPLPTTTIGLFHGNLDAGSNALRRHLYRHVTPLLGGRKPLPPCFFNHWFGLENRFSAELLRPEVDASADAGLEYFVVDAGWFEGGFRAGIGNWRSPDRRKFPDGVEPFARYVTDRGLKYGTWFEPEFAAADSQIVRDHPDWFLSPPPAVDYECLFFNSCERMMNFALPEVRRWWVALFEELYDRWSMRWVRWDSNVSPRPMWEHGEAPGRRGWNQVRNVLGLYETLDQILAAMPDLVVEQCASGGTRIEPGLLRRGHTLWMHDHTTSSDLIRMFQIGGNTFLPANYLNTNVLDPGAREGDYLCRSMGGFGVSSRISAWPAASRKRLCRAVERFKRIRPLLLGDYRRIDPMPRTARQSVRVSFRSGRHHLTFEFRPPRASVSWSGGAP